MQFTELHTKVKKNYLKTNYICLCGGKYTISTKKAQIRFNFFNLEDVSLKTFLVFKKLISDLRQFC